MCDAVVREADVARSLVVVVCIPSPHPPNEPA